MRLLGARVTDPISTAATARPGRRRATIDLIGTPSTVGRLMEWRISRESGLNYPAQSFGCAMLNTRGACCQETLVKPRGAFARLPDWRLWSLLSIQIAVEKNRSKIRNLDKFWQRGEV